MELELVKEESAHIDPLHDLFKSNQIFNINKNALFIKKKDKEEMCSDEESEDNEEEITELLKDGFEIANTDQENVQVKDNNKPMTKAEEVKKKKIQKARVRVKEEKAALEESAFNAKFLKRDVADIATDSKISKEIDQLKYKTKRSSISGLNP